MDERRTIVATLLRCKGQFARPPGISRAEEQDAIGRGYLRFNECYEITAAGRELIASYHAGAKP